MDDQLAGDATARRLHAAATRAGYLVSIKPFADPPGLALVGAMNGWHFLAIHASRGWDVIIRRPGWPVEPSNTVRLSALLKAQTPVVV